MSGGSNWSACSAGDTETLNLRDVNRDSATLGGRTIRRATGMPQINLATSLTTQDDPARGVVHVALAELGETAERVSAAIGMPSAYLATYLQRGLPRALPAWVRRRLATYLGVPDHALR